MRGHSRARRSGEQNDVVVEDRCGSKVITTREPLFHRGAVTVTSIDRDRDVYGRLLRNVAVGGGKSARR
jgi:hypothetical protein